jgi:DNA-binding transcriptional ArsR family regulator
MTNITFDFPNMLYNTFVFMNMRESMKPLKKTCDLLKSIANPVRAQILLAIGGGEACVCHLEALLGLRQAAISQQLMILRRKKIIKSRREGKYVFYRLAKPEVLEIIQAAGAAVGVSTNSLMIPNSNQCECPHCEIDELEIAAASEASNGLRR